MKSMRAIMLTAGVLTLGGCTVFDTYSEIEALNQAEHVGSPFAQSLASEYKDFANFQLDEAFDYPDALHFARKGLAASAGEAVMPEPVTDWNLSNPHIKELSGARGRLIIAYDLGAREVAPATAAKAQVKFDCWIEQQEENWKSQEVVTCKQEFLTAIAELEGLVQQPSAPKEPVKELPPLVPEDALYLVFFNWDSAELSAGAKNVIEAIAEEVAKNPPEQVIINGYADTSGDKDYNKKLGFKRASNVRDALVALGVSEDMMAIDSLGEEELLVSTSDDVREPANRRVNVSFK